LKGNKMFEKIKAFWSLFQKGKEVTNPEKWKNHQITGNIVGGFILAIVAAAKGMGYELPIDESSAYQIGGGIVAIANILLVITTSKKVGLPTSGSSVPAVQQASTEAPAIVQTEPKATYTEEQLAAARKAMDESRGRSKGGDSDNFQRNNDYRN